MGWLGWPNAAAMSWAGWLFATAILIGAAVDTGRATIALFAVFLACAVYAGQPETVVLVGMALAVFTVVFMIVRRHRPESHAPVLRPVVDLGVAAAAGAALSAPLALPGLQLASKSVVRVVSSYGALLPTISGTWLFQGFDGLPVAGNQWFGNSDLPRDRRVRRRDRRSVWRWWPWGRDGGAPRFLPWLPPPSPWRSSPMSRRSCPPSTK